MRGGDKRGWYPSSGPGLVTGGAVAGFWCDENSSYRSDWEAASACRIAIRTSMYLSVKLYGFCYTSGWFCYYPRANWYAPTIATLGAAWGSGNSTAHIRGAGAPGPGVCKTRDERYIYPLIWESGSLCGLNVGAPTVPVTGADWAQMLRGALGAGSLILEIGPTVGGGTLTPCALPNYHCDGIYIYMHWWNILLLFTQSKSEVVTWGHWQNRWAGGLVAFKRVGMVSPWFTIAVVTIRNGTFGVSTCSVLYR